jgi:ribosomal protein L7Ae-like RNA K-turn-binding protein
MAEYREKSACETTSGAPSGERAAKPLAIGVREVTKALNTGNVLVLIVSSHQATNSLADVIITMAAVKGVPVCLVRIDSAKLGSLVGVQRCSVVGITKAASEASKVCSQLALFASSLATSIPSPIAT